MRRFLSTCLAWLLVGGSLVLAQAVVPPIAPQKTNISRFRWLQYNMVAGRIAVSGGNMQFGPANLGARQKERLEIRVARGDVDMRYELNSPEDQLSINVGDGGLFQIRRTHTDPHYLMTFEQPIAQQLELTVEMGNVRRTARAETFWHLYLAEPEMVRQHLIPLLELLHGSWQLAVMGDEIEDTLVQRAPNLRLTDIERWGRLVDELASPKFAERENAQRELFKAGQLILPYLEQLDRRKLDAEQVSRIRAVVDSLSLGHEDTNDRIANWLAADPRVWLTMATREEIVKRRIAGEQLKQILGPSVDFDPAADPQTRQRQLARIWGRLRDETPEAGAEAPVVQEAK